MPALEVDREIRVERHAGDDGHHAAHSRKTEGEAFRDSRAKKGNILDVGGQFDFGRVRRFAPGLHAGIGTATILGFAFRGDAPFLKIHSSQTWDQVEEIVQAADEFVRDFELNAETGWRRQPIQRDNLCWCRNWCDARP